MMEIFAKGLYTDEGASEKTLKNVEEEILIVKQEAQTQTIPSGD